MKIPKNDPTPEQVKRARSRAGLTQREASRLIFGPDSCRTVQNWETGARQAPLGSYVLFLLMTDQITVQDAKRAVVDRVLKQ